jgi:hypothetical protein
VCALVRLVRKSSALHGLQSGRVQRRADRPPAPSQGVREAGKSGARHLGTRFRKISEEAVGDRAFGGAHLAWHV